MNTPAPKIVYADDAVEKTTFFSRSDRSAWDKPSGTGSFPHLARILFELPQGSARRVVDFVRFVQRLGEHLCIISVDGGDQWQLESAIKPHVPAGMIVELEWSP